MFGFDDGGVGLAGALVFGDDQVPAPNADLFTESLDGALDTEGGKMKFDCPYGWKSVTKCGNVTFESATVNICDGVCDSCDRCGIEQCEFYDTSPEATKPFLLAHAREHTLEHLLAPTN